MSENDAKNYAAIAAARARHDQECPGNAVEIHLSPYDMERLDWEEGEMIAGLKVVGNDQINTGMMRVVCDRDKQRDDETIEAVAEDRDLVTA